MGVTRTAITAVIIFTVRRRLCEISNNINARLLQAAGEKKQYPWLWLTGASSWPENRVRRVREGEQGRKGWEGLAERPYDKMLGRAECIGRERERGSARQGTRQMRGDGEEHLSCLRDKWREGGSGDSLSCLFSVEAALTGCWFWDQLPATSASSDRALGFCRACSGLGADEAFRKLQKSWWECRRIWCRLPTTATS